MALVSQECKIWIDYGADSGVIILGRISSRERPVKEDDDRFPEPVCLYSCLAGASFVVPDFSSKKFCASFSAFMAAGAL